MARFCGCGTKFPNRRSYGDLPKNRHKEKMIFIAFFNNFLKIFKKPQILKNDENFQHVKKICGTIIVEKVELWGFFSKRMEMRPPGKINSPLLKKIPVSYPLPHNCFR